MSCASYLLFALIANCGLESFPSTPPGCGKPTRMYQMLFQMLNRLFLTKDPYTTELCTKGTLKRAIATTEARNATETPASLPMCVTDVTGVTPGSIAELNPPSATNVAIYTQEGVVQQARPNQITPHPREMTQGNNNQPTNDKDDFYVYIDDVYEKHTCQVYSTPVNVDQLEQALSSHPDKQFVEKLCRELREGAKIGYTGPRMPRESRNLPSANKNPETIQTNLAKEVELGRTVGPFDKPPFPNFQVSPIGLVPKKQPGQFRTIFHLSYPKTGDSINSFIPKEDYSLQYTTIDNAISAIQRLGRGTYMAKTDILSALGYFPYIPKTGSS